MDCSPAGMFLSRTAAWSEPTSFFRAENIFVVPHLHPGERAEHGLRGRAEARGGSGLRRGRPGHAGRRCAGPTQQEETAPGEGRHYRGMSRRGAVEPVPGSGTGRWGRAAQPNRGLGPGAGRGKRGRRGAPAAAILGLPPHREGPGHARRGYGGRRRTEGRGARSPPRSRGTAPPVIPSKAECSPTRRDPPV